MARKYNGTNYEKDVLITQVLVGLVFVFLGAGGLLGHLLFKWF